jgi:Arc/MetJ-type ribon-helix-helix transcriptional regulator
MKTITVNLPDELVELLESRVAAGEFDSFDEALACAVAEQLFAPEGDSVADVEDADLRAKLQAGLDQADRGEVIEMEVAMARLRARAEAKSGALAVTP